MRKPMIFDIRGFSLDDGPGIRTTVFLKGCPLSCIWCHNPESWSPDRQIAFYPELCIGCEECVSICPERAADMNLRERVNRERCTACGACTVVCPSTALKTIGAYYPPDELVGRLLRNRVFYETSRGGITFSGGEPTLHTTYLSEVMCRLKAEGIHVAIQTSGAFDHKIFIERLLPFIDLIYFDLKVMDPEIHYAYTGTDNYRILSNFRHLASAAHKKVVPRTPLVPGLTATEKNLRDIYGFIRQLDYEGLQLLPYNPGGITKRRSLGIPASCGLPETIMTKEEEIKLQELA